MQGAIFFTYGLISHTVFFITFLYAIGWVGDLLLPVTIDSRPLVPLSHALLVNGGLLSLFALQYSVMARTAFKTWWTRHIPVAAERSTYVLFSSLALIALFVFWQPMGGTLWRVENPAGVAVLYILFAIRLEERDLLTALGEDYAAYRREVPMLIPALRRYRDRQTALEGQV